MNTKIKNRRAVTSIGIVAIAAIMIGSVAALEYAEANKHKNGGGGDSKGANKTMIGEPTIDVVRDQDGWATIINGTIKTSSPSDLVITHFQECAIHTGLKLDAMNENNQVSAIREEVRLLVDGNVIPASFNDDPNPETFGIVTMCARAYAIDTNVLSNIDALCVAQQGMGGVGCELPASFFDSYIRTKQTHGWEWIALNVGQYSDSMDHLVEVQSRTFTALDGMEIGTDEFQDEASTTESCTKDSEAPNRECTDTILEVGKKTLIVVEDKLAVSASLSN